MVDSTVDIGNSAALTALVNQANVGKGVVTLTEQGETRAILLSLEMYEYLLGLQQHRQRELLPPQEFQQQFQAALTEAGYASKEGIVTLVQEVKQEIYQERQQHNDK
jgi:hypothetical protein